MTAAVVVSNAPAGDIADAPCPDTAGAGTATCPVGTTGVAYSFRFLLMEGAGCGPGKESWSVSSGNFPPGLSLASNGVVSGIPTQAGNFTFYVRVSHPNIPGSCAGDFSDKQVTIPIVPGLAKLTIGPESTTPGTRGTPYSLQMTATVAAPKTWSVSAGSLPTGLAIDASTGLISGTPTAAGQFNFTVLAKMNGDARSDSKALGIVVRDPLSILGSDPFTEARRALGEVSAPFEAMLTASGGNGTYAWALTSGALPSGLLFTDGAISGTPTVAGVYPVTVTVTDTEGRVANYPSRIVVAAKLAVSTLLLRPGRVGKVYAAKVATAGGVKPATWRIFIGPLPRGVRFDRVTGRLFGIPSRPGRYRVTFEATDTLGVTAKKTLSIVIVKSLVKKKK